MRKALISRRRGLALVTCAGIAVVAAVVVGTALAAPPAPGPAPGPGPGLFTQSGDNGFGGGNKGSAMVIDEGLGGKGALLTSISGAANEAGFGNVGVKGGGVPKTFADLTDVEAEFNVTQGTCVGGAPRWNIDVETPPGTKPKQAATLTVYFDNGHQPFGGCNAGTQQETNIIGNATTRWAIGPGNPTMTYAQVLATYGSWKLDDVTIVVDAGWAQSSQLHPNIQQVLVQNLKVNNNTYLPLPS